MSNVTVEEIVDLTADAFSIPRDVMRAKGKLKRMSWAHFARHCATMLARRHTSASWKRIAQAVGTSVGGSQTSAAREAVARFADEADCYPMLKAIVDGIEREIDAIHERRADASEVKKQAVWTTKRKGQSHDQCSRL